MQSLVLLSSVLNCQKLRSLSCTICTHRAYSIVRPASVQPLRTVPKEIARPPYIKSTFLSKIADNILHRMTKPDIKSKDDIERMKRSCQIAREVLNMVARNIQPGITTDELDRIAHEECVANGAYPSPLLYKGFPKSICTSVNNVACHGIPDNRCLQDGDIVNVDVTVIESSFVISRLVSVSQFVFAAFHDFKYAHDRYSPSFILVSVRVECFYDLFPAWLSNFHFVEF